MPRSAAEIAGYFSILADIFLRLIKMIIAPLVFATVVAGITGTGDTKTVGRIGLKALRMVRHRLAGLAAARDGPREPVPAGRQPQASAARRRPVDQSQDRRALRSRNSSSTSSRAASSRRWRPTRSCRSSSSRCSSASRSASVKTRPGDDHHALHRRARARDAEAHRIRDAVRAGGRVRRDRRRDHDAGDRRPRDLRQVHRLVLREPRRAVDDADRRRLRLPRPARVRADGGWCASR